MLHHLCCHDCWDRLPSRTKKGVPKNSLVVFSLRKDWFELLNCFLLEYHAKFSNERIDPNIGKIVLDLRSLSWVFCAPLFTPNSAIAGRKARGLSYTWIRSVKFSVLLEKSDKWRGASWDWTRNLLSFSSSAENAIDTGSNHWSHLTIHLIQMTLMMC